MKRMARFGLFLALPVISIAIINGCNNAANASEPTRPAAKLPDNTSSKKTLSLTSEFKTYWYGGEAEISSFELEQVRYGEIRKGNAVQVFVTEPFLADKQVKANYSNPDNIPVLKLNSTKKFLTGIYPYSIMTSTFSPVKQQGHALKVTNSVQEWCGQVYTQLNNRDSFEVLSHSYFESEGDQDLRLEKTVLEDEIWNMIRLRPDSLPVGDFEAIPAMEYLRLNHKEIKAYAVNARLNVSDGMVNYILNYPQLGRSLDISFSQDFPHQIEGWSESIKRGPGSTTLTSRARRLKTLKTAYWRQNGNRDLILRDSLGLP